MNINVNQLITDFGLMLGKNTISKPFSFNVLDEQQGHIVENSHSNILLRLLQYRNTCGFVFLESFLARLNFNIDLKGKSICFEREYKNIDMLIFVKDDFAILIENKVNGAFCRNNQIGGYVDTVLHDSAIFSQKKQAQGFVNHLWVVYLDRIGSSEPDASSKANLRQIGLCDPVLDPSLPLEGNRYASANYSEHILPWLEEDVLPIVMHKDTVLLAGIVQYIDYLKGENFFNLHNLGSLSQNNYTSWLKSQVGLSCDLVKRNKELAELTSELIDKKTDKNAKHVNLLLNLINAVNEEPMNTFLDVSRSYFKDCEITHHFTFYYCFLRHKLWKSKPLRVSLSWVKMGMNRLINGKDYTFAVSVCGPKPLQNDFKSHFDKDLRSMGYVHESKITRLLEYRIALNIPEPILQMPDNQLRQWLEVTYGKIASQKLIDKISNYLNSM